MLLNDAKLVTGEQLEKICRKYAMVQRHAEPDRPSDDVQRRYVRRRDRADGMVKVEAVLHPDEAAIVWAALERAAKDLGGEPQSTDGPAGTSESGETPPRPRFDRADGLVAIAQGFASGGQASSPIEVVVTVPASALREGAVRDLTHVGVLPDGECVEGETARRLSCDAGIVEIAEDDDGQALSIGRKTRAIPTAIRRALLKRDRCCRFPGCANYLYVDGHHVKHWADGGETALHNLVTLCTRHHRFVHEYMYRVAFDAHGQPQFFDSHGRPAQDVPPRLQLNDLGWDHVFATNRAHGAIPETSPCWDGSEINYDLMIDYLIRADDGLVSPDDY